MRITKKSHPVVYSIARHVYPDYTGRRIFVDYSDTIDTGYNANWSGGTRTFYKFIRLDNGAILNVPDFAPWKRPDNEVVKLPPGAACVTHAFFCGHEVGVTVYFPKENQIKE
jgi:hypothetical protein